MHNHVILIQIVSLYIYIISSYELECNSIDRPLPKEKKKKLLGLKKNDLGIKIMTIFIGSRAKTYGYLIDDGIEDKKTKGTKKCIIKRKLKFENYKSCLEATEPKNKKAIQKKIKLTQIVFKKIINNS